MSRYAQKARFIKCVRQHHSPPVVTNNLMELKFTLIVSIPLPPAPVPGPPHSPSCAVCRLSGPRGLGPIGDNVSSHSYDRQFRVQNILQLRDLQSEHRHALNVRISHISSEDKLSTIALTPLCAAGKRNLKATTVTVTKLQNNHTHAHTHTPTHTHTHTHTHKPTTTTTTTNNKRQCQSPLLLFSYPAEPLYYPICPTFIIERLVAVDGHFFGFNFNLQH